MRLADEVQGRARQYKRSGRDAAPRASRAFENSSTSIALLTSAVVDHYADHPAKVTELVSTIRELEDRFLARSLEAGDLRKLGIPPAALRA
jgi:hypothetical protein